MIECVHMRERIVCLTCEAGEPQYNEHSLCACEVRKVIRPTTKVDEIVGGMRSRGYIRILWEI